MKRFIRENLFILILILVLGLLLYLTYLKGFWPERGFLCPISYGQNPIKIRNDYLGDGYFGAKRKGGKIHKGVDLAAPVGSPVLAAMRGRVIEVGFHPKGYGHYVEIIHREGYRTIYAHLSEVSVKEGDRIYRGEQIGKAGKTGNASYSQIKPHLHFEIRKDKTPLNPMEFFQQEKPGEGEFPKSPVDAEP